MIPIDFEVQGNYLRYGKDLQQFVGFYAPIQQAEQTGDYSFRIVTAWGEYEFLNINDKHKMHVNTLNGKDITDLGRARLMGLI